MAIDLGDAAVVQRCLASDRLRDLPVGGASVLLISSAATVRPTGPIVSPERDALVRALNLNLGTVLILAAVMIAS
ncbi:hypothetical protein [Accumulibacter sp.]|uniref:hypothetical protein n=1 Tax=Accumulibacter sp. TaxID=2053492 RepID=UPI002636F044|nr:hypothetical protein [Accumulibacter sp.]